MIVRSVQDLKKGHGWNAADDEYGDMLSFGIIDPTKVTKAALENAVSIAGMVLTTNCLVTDEADAGGAAAPMAAAPEMY